jgi:hypothetical protein
MAEDIWQTLPFTVQEKSIFQVSNLYLFSSTLLHVSTAAIPILYTNLL